MAVNRIWPGIPKVKAFSVRREQTGHAQSQRG